MSRTITVKGTGKVSAKPDFLVISMKLEAKDKKYEKAMDKSAEQLEILKEAPMMAKSIDIEPDDINVSDTAAFVWEIE